MMKKWLCNCPFDHENKDLIIAKDGYPLELFKKRPFLNFIRKILHGDHIEGHTCYEERTGIKVFRNK